jgi:hypothetical protein
MDGSLYAGTDRDYFNSPDTTMSYLGDIAQWLSVGAGFAINIGCFVKKGAA